MVFTSRTLTRLLNKIPGKEYFGVYRFLPIFFAFGAALEFAMIHWTVGEINFCKFMFHINHLNFFFFFFVFLQCLYTIHIGN